MGNKEIYTSENKILRRATNNAYALLRQRPRSIAEVRRRLALKGYSDEITEECVAHLVKIGELDDARFSRFWVESRMHMNPMGDIVLRHELKEKGVAGELIDEVLAAKKETVDDYEVALGMAREQFERFSKLDRRKATKRVYDFLARRGFEFDVVRRVIETLK